MISTKASTIDFSLHHHLSHSYHIPTVGRRVSVNRTFDVRSDRGVFSNRRPDLRLGSILLGMKEDAELLDPRYLDGKLLKRAKGYTIPIRLTKSVMDLLWREHDGYNELDYCRN
jgi:hypothetical protein